MGRNLGLEDQVTTFLMDYAVTPIAAQCFGEITALRSRGSFRRKRGLHLEPNAAAGWLEVCQAGQNRRL
jgi:hypothetical protein